MYRRSDIYHPSSTITSTILSTLSSLYLDLLGPSQRGCVEVEDNVGSLEGNVTEDVDANISRRLKATEALAANGSRL